ncbi:DUF2946 domain-containing protein [Halomonas elongata]|uniref:DUF2946 domain protein n=3 Tax=Halomonas elongata TaxID=2746 RepID=E1V5J5_HALED|nr:DUF2946 domain-containing protein [Halomonas elongata]MBW5800004.1 DUF2946 domain-containing protein [Halomonas elongata]MDL4864754.1 DUF2946 domain-containing protein [Halomonas elongata]OBX33887.1 hypothetical protein A8U91_02930 [Halomonas elongata]RAW07645.1 DUF2946 domain-containing protein [Halomonas elongata]WBF16890.1 DUF2946 domain-containing protein [Halomonas elongata]
MLHRFQHHRSRLFARFALLAMLLLVIGPLIGQVSAAGVHDHAGHTTHVGHTMETSPHMAMSASGETDHGTPHHAAVLHWQVQCGYCSLFQQMPVLMAMLPRVVPMASHAITAPVVATRTAHGGPAVFPQALTRAPPALS